jgi:malate dehydrogenase (oxaloacetate-decarboxylating)(NADP+)
VIGVSLVLARGRTVLVADTAVTEMPDGKDIAEIAVEAAAVARKLGYEPRVALLSFSTFGHPPGERAAKVQEAVRILDQQRVDFEYDGEMAAGRRAQSRSDGGLTRSAASPGPANVLVMPAFHSAAISTKMLAGTGRRDGDRTAAGRARQFGADRQSVLEGHGLDNMARTRPTNVSG